MASILPKVHFAVKQKLLRHLRRRRDAGPRTRYLVIINLLTGGSARDAERPGVRSHAERGN